METEHINPATNTPGMESIITENTLCYVVPNFELISYIPTSKAILRQIRWTISTLPKSLCCDFIGAVKLLEWPKDRNSSHTISAVKHHDNYLFHHAIYCGYYSRAGV